MAESTYEGQPGVAPVRVRTLRSLRLRAKRGQFESFEESSWGDCFPERLEPTGRAR